MIVLSNQPRIVFVNRFFFPDESATSQILTDVAAHLARRDFRVTVIASRYCLRNGTAISGRETVHHGIEVRRLWSPSGKTGNIVTKLVQFACFYPLALIALLRTVRPGDVIVAKTDPPLISVPAWIAAKVKGARLVAWMQDVYPEVASELGVPIAKGLIGRLLRSLRNRSLKQADTTVAIGEVMAEKLRAEGVPATRIEVIHNWADDAAITPIPASKSRLRADLGLGSEDFVFGYSGNLGRAHEVETLVGAALRLVDRPNIKFLFVGGGNQYEKLWSFAADRGLDNLVFAPHQPRDSLQDSLGAADVHWLSLRPELEGLIVPSKLYGILAAGRPVVAITAGDGEVARVLVEHKCGFIVRPGDSASLAKCTTTLAGDPGLRWLLGRSARKASERAFSKRGALARWEQLLRDVGSRANATQPRCDTIANRNSGIV